MTRAKTVGGVHTHTHTHEYFYKNKKGIIAFIYNINIIVTDC